MCIKGPVQAVVVVTFSNILKPKQDLTLTNSTLISSGFHCLNLNEASPMREAEMLHSGTLGWILGVH